jgi:hypothetical protein
VGSFRLRRIIIVLVLMYALLVAPANNKPRNDFAHPYSD